MTEEGIFLGGGNMAGNFKDWTIPNPWFRFSSSYAMEWSLEGAWTFDGERTGTDRVYANNGWWNVGGTSSFSLYKSKNFIGHVNDFDKFYPKHYNVDWYIKYK